MEAETLTTIEEYKDTRRTIFELCVELLAVFLLFHFVICLACVEGASMEPTYHQNTILLANRFATPKHGDAVLAAEPAYGTVVKRVLAKGGDSISIAEGQVFINGEALDEPYVVYNDTRSMGEAVIPDGHYFLAGDNRAHSTDSRNGLGLFTEDDIIGVVFFNIF